MASGAVVNVRRDVDDKFYRYKMPVMLTKVEGRGNGIKTVIPNMSDVAKALSRPPQYTTKFFGCELGAQTILDDKADRWIVNGEHDANRLRELLDVFIDKFVLCAACKNPETDLVITKSEDIIRDCKACGQQTKVDMRHKLTTFILKNPPKKVKKTRRASNEANKPSASGEGDDAASPAADDEDADALTLRLQAEAAELAPVEKTAMGKEESANGTAAITHRVKQMSLDAEGSDEDKGDDPMEQLRLWIEINRDDATPEKLRAEIDNLGIKEKHKTVQVVVECIFSSKMLTGKEMERYNPLIKELVSPIEEKEKHQKALLGGLERLVGVNYPDLIEKVPHILMAWYQDDILTEEAAKQWGTHVSKKYVDRDTSKRVRKASEPFLKWLEDADEDDEEEE